MTNVALDSDGCNWPIHALTNRACRVVRWRQTFLDNVKLAEDGHVVGGLIQLVHELKLQLESNVYTRA